MNVITILIWAIIAIIGAISIIFVKRQYSGNELETEEKTKISDNKTINGIISSGKEKVNFSNKTNTNSHTNPNNSLYGNRSEIPQTSNNYIVPESKDNVLTDFEYESENQILINYGNEVKKFQEPIKQSQMDIMTQNNDDKTELKDLFTIDELIKESKRKDSEREKEAKKINTEKEDLTEIKESIKEKQQQTTLDEPLIEEVIKDESIEEILKEESEEETVEEPTVEETLAEVEANSASQKDIEDAITSASNESEDEVESISEDKNITDVLLDSQDDSLDIPNEEIKEPTLKTPNKVGQTKDYEFGAPIDDADLFEDDDESMDLDYRKDLDKFTNKIKGSKIFQEVKDKFVQEKDEVLDESGDETYIRNVREYDEYEPIINETHVDIDASYEDLHDISYDERLRQENTRRVFNLAKNSNPQPELAQEKIGAIKDKPARDNIKLTINNNEVVLKKGDEIIYNHLGETYSSQVYAINGDDISVKYRRQDITIKPSDVKKIY